MSAKKAGLTSMPAMLSAAVLTVWICGHSPELRAADWPTFRHDAARSAATDEQLAPTLHLQWSRRYPALVPAWLGEFPSLRFDDHYEPIVVGKTLVFGSSDDDSVTALDTETGKMRWRFYANGPVRLAPVASKGRIYFGADDGVFYCLDAAGGTLQWRYDTALSERKGFIEGRLTTICPVRGAPVVENGRVVFVAGIWGFEDSGLFILDAETGKLIRKHEWVRGQGYPCAVGESLYLSMGRTGALQLRRADGAVQDGLGGWLAGAYFDHLIAGTGSWLVQRGALRKTGKAPTGLVCDPRPGRDMICFYRPVIQSDRIYYSAARPHSRPRDVRGPEVGDLVCASLKDPSLVQVIDKKGKPILSQDKKPQTKLVVKELWRLPRKTLVASLGKQPAPKAAQYVIVDIKAGNRLYGHYGSTVFAVDLPTGGKGASVSWHTRVEGTPARLVAADGKLFVVTLEGTLSCFGPKQGTPKSYAQEQRTPADVDDEWSRRATAIIDRTGIRDGYCLVLGLRSGRLAEELFRRSRLHIIAVDKDPKRVAALRAKLSYLKDTKQTTESSGTAKDGTPLTMVSSTEIAPSRRRVVVVEGDPATYPFPPYMANLIVSEAPGELTLDANGIRALFHALRPYGGTICLELPSDRHFDPAVVPHAKVRRQAGFSLLTRAGALEGSSDWTHEWGDAANTLKSDDRLAMPLGMLWTGGRSAGRHMYFERHAWPPAPIVIEGRQFITGPSGMTAVDIYTGRVLWEVRGDLFKRIIQRFQQAGRGLAGAPDGIYLCAGGSILRFDPATGKLLSEFGLPADGKKDDTFVRVRIWKDMLVTSVARQRRNARLLALDRHSGRVLWSVGTDRSFRFVAIGNGKVFTWDGSTRDAAERRARRRGHAVPPDPGRSLRAFDARTGKELWRTQTDAVVGWLSYSEPFDVLVASTKNRILAYSGRDGHELWRHYSQGVGFYGHPSGYWQKVILWRDWVIDQRGPGMAYDLVTGRQIQRRHPVTLEPVPWEFTRQGHHCNFAVASENFLTFRSGHVSYVDLTNLGTGTFPGVRSGCTNSLIVADGVLTSPMYAHQCRCAYEFFTSMAFTHVPKAESWTYQPMTLDFLARADIGRAKRLGINFNAPGERRSPNGTLWFGLGARHGRALPGLPVRLGTLWTGPGARYGYPLRGLSVDTRDVRRFQAPETGVQGRGPRWVFAGGLEGLKPFTVPLCADKKAKAERYTVRLYFLEPDDLKPGQRVFSVRLQNREVLKDLDIVREAGGPMRGIVKEVSGVSAGAALAVAFVAKAGKPVVSGIEVLIESSDTIPPEVHSLVVEAHAGKPVPIRLPYTDPDGPGPFTFRIAKAPAKGSLAGRGPVVTYAAKAGAVGMDTFTWVVNDGRADSSPAVVTIKLASANVAPEARDLRVRAIAGRPIRIEVPFSDADRQPGNYRFELVTKPAHGTVQWQSHNRFVYAAKSDFAGTDRFTWKVNDGQADSSAATVAVSVTLDTQGPKVAWIDSAGPNDRITVVFDEPVAKADAENASNYAIAPRVTVKSLKLSDDGRSVTLGTSELKEGVDYSLVIKHVRDRAPKHNVIKSGTRVPFKYVFVGNGVWAEYYEGRDLTGKKIGERVDPRVSFDWKTVFERKEPFPTLTPDREYSMRWTGRLKADHTEQVMLYLFRNGEQSRPRARIWVNGTLLANQFFGPVSMEAGKVYELKVELKRVRPPRRQYYTVLQWSSLSTPRETIPQSHLGTVHPRH